MVVEPLDEEEEEFTRSLAMRGGGDGGPVEERCFLERDGNALEFLRTTSADEVDGCASDLSLRLEEAAKTTEASLRIGWDGGGEEERSDVDFADGV